jgi:hypothetical protein
LGRIGIEFGDEAHPRVSTRRAENLWRASGLPLEAFLDLVATARTLTLTHAPAIVRRRVHAGEPHRKNLMPYFFATLEGLAAPDPTEEPDLPATAIAAPPAVAEPAAAGALWQRVLGELRGSLAPEAFRRWLEPTRVVCADEHLLRIAVRDAAQRHWLEMRLRSRIEAALAAVGGREIRLEYGIDGED